MWFQLLFQMETLSWSKSPWLWIPGIYLLVWIFFITSVTVIRKPQKWFTFTWTAAHIQYPTVGLCQFIITEIQFSPQEPQLHHHLQGIIVNLLKWEHCAPITWWKWNLRHLCKTHVWKQEINGICHLSNGNGPEPRDMMEDPLLLRRCSPKCRAGYKKGESSLLGKWSQETEIRGIRRVKQEKSKSQLIESCQFHPTLWIAEKLQNFRSVHLSKDKRVIYSSAPSATSQNLSFSKLWLHEPWMGFHRAPYHILIAAQG